MCSVASRLPGALSDPRRGSARVKSAVPQRRRPVVTQIDGYHPTIGGRFGAQVGQHTGLELDDLRLVDLEHHRVPRPRQPIGTSVESRRQNHGLANARGHGAYEEVVEIPCAHGDLLTHLLTVEQRIVTVIKFAVRQLVEVLEADGLDERIGVRIVDEGIGLLGRQRARCGRSGRRGAHAGRQVPGVAVSSGHKTVPTFASR
jgi:hypothetical protein